MMIRINSFGKPDIFIDDYPYELVFETPNEKIAFYRVIDRKVEEISYERETIEEQESIGELRRYKIYPKITNGFYKESYIIITPDSDFDFPGVEINNNLKFTLNHFEESNSWSLSFLGLDIVLPKLLWAHAKVLQA